ncbi:unnamed protein product [Pleuronectes platessa]|uniref:Uncharacterized protein n=1 Tax=Pleuronectes platessa TaxID=8262 RepID=A0A9N7TXX3_PLEPL|nr:unnamed protein product [Pleuronectes platessa]
MDDEPIWSGSPSTPPPHPSSILHPPSSILHPPSSTPWERVEAGHALHSPVCRLFNAPAASVQRRGGGFNACSGHSPQSSGRVHLNKPIVCRLELQRLQVEIKQSCSDTVGRAAEMGGGGEGEVIGGELTLTSPLGDICLQRVLSGWKVAEQSSYVLPGDVLKMELEAE